MNGTTDLERVLADWMASAAPSRAPSQTVEDAIAITSRGRPRPSWLATMRTPAMTIERRTLVGSPTVRLAYYLLLLLVAAALAAGSIAIGAQFVVRAEDAPQVGNGLIGVDAQGDIILASPDGSSMGTLTEGPDTDVSPTFSPDGEWLAFWSTPEEGPARLVVMRPDGSDRTEVEPAPGWLFQTAIVGTSNISWSPDGRRIASLVTSGDETTIALIEGATSDFSTLDIGPLAASFLTWSPDGEWLAYVGRMVGREVYVIRPDGTDERSLTPVSMDAASYLSVDWSPDSNLLTYTRLEPGGSGHAMYSVDVTTGEESMVAASPTGGSYWWPTFSPDGTRIATGGAEGGVAAVSILPADGQGEIERLAIPEPVTTEDVTWAPDGSSLLVFSHDLETLYIVPIDEPGATIGVPTGGSIWSPSWQPVLPD